MLCFAQAGVGLGNLAAGVGDVMYSMLTPVDGRLLMMGWVLTSRARSEDFDSK